MCRRALTPCCGVLSENLTVIRVGKKLTAYFEPKFPRLFDKRETLECAWCQLNPIHKFLSYFSKTQF
jgi:hypothetical protein